MPVPSAPGCTPAARYAVCLLLAGFPLAPAQAPAQPGPHDPIEMATFFDGLYAGLERAQHLSGMTVAVVRDGQIILLRGFGYANLEKRERVDPARTLFRLGSITKPLTWTAVMQLSAEGRVDLNAPVDQFIPAELSVHSPWNVSPTLHDLMTHTPGYDDLPVVGLFRREPYKGVLREALVETLPIIVRRPGELVSYSNFGTALAGLIVERISNLSWEQYVQRRIFTPLGMTSATVLQPIPAELAPQMATGYRWANGELQPQGFEYVPLAPAGAGSASASAMANFMLAHLQQGRFGNEQLMPEWAARQMDEPLYRAAPQLGAWLHGLYELRPASPRVYGHGGDTMWFHSLMALFPETNTGLFISLNSDSGARARGEVYKAFLERYYPQPEFATPKLLDGAAARVTACSGWFSGTRQPRRTAARLLALTNTLSVSKEGPNRLVLNGIALPAPMHFVETEPWVYRETRGQELLVFRPQAGGSTELAFLSANPGSALERVSVFRSPGVQFTLAGLASLGILISFFAYPITVLRAHLLGLDTDHKVTVAYIAGWFASAAFVIAIIAFGSYLQDPQEIVFGLPTSLILVQWCGRLGAVLTIVATASVVILWARGLGRTGGRVAHGLVVLCQIILALWCTRWSLLG